ncbi:MAG: hypothetical protein RR645_01325 [Clostridium sp.]
MDRKVYLILSHTGTKFSGFINMMTRYEYTHSSIALDKELKELYSFGRKNMRIPFIAGFVREDVNSGVFYKYKNTKCIIYELDVKDYVYENIKNIIDGFEQEKNRYRYNILGLPLIMFNIPYKREEHFVCSQFVAYVLINSGAIDLNKEFTVVKPRDFCEIDNKRIIYNGVLNEYNVS